MDSSKEIDIQLRILKFFRILPDKVSEYLTCVEKLWGLTSFLWSGLILVCCQAISVFYVETTDQMVKELILLCTTSTVAIKLALFYLHRKNLPNILNILDKLDARVYDENSIRAMEGVYSQCRQALAIYCTYFVSLTAILLELIFVDRNERTWKSTALVPTEFAQQPSVYYGVLIIEGIGNALNCTLGYAIDTYSFSLINLLAGHIEALSFQLCQFGTSSDAVESRSRKLRLLKYHEHFNLLDEYVQRTKNY